MNKQMTQEVINEIAKAYRRLLEISQTKIVTPSVDAEKAALEKYLATTVPQYLGELIACWFAVRTEYEPLINHVSNFLERVGAASAIKAKQQQQAQEQEKQA